MSLIDARFATLKEQGFTGSTPDMLLQWLLSNGATIPNTTDAWKQMIVAQLGFEATGDVSTDWSKLLSNLGYDGQSNDQEAEFWLDGGAFSFFYFNGSTQLATFTNPIVPRGLPFRISFETQTPLGAVGSRVVFSGSDVSLNSAGAYPAPIFPIIAFQDVAGAQVPLIIPAYVLADRDVWVIDYTATGVTATLNGTPFSFANPAQSGNVPKSFGMLPILTLGGAVGSTNLWRGVVRNFRYDDLAPIQGREYNTPNNATQGLLDTPIAIDGSEPFEISFEWKALYNGVAQYLISAPNTSVDPVGIWITALDEVRLKIGTGSGNIVSWDTALDNIPTGQNVKMRFVGDGTADTKLYIDDVLYTKAFGNLSTKKGTLQRLGVFSNGLEQRSQGIIANLQIKATAPIVAGIHGFLPYGSSHPDVIEFFPGTQNVVGATGIGSLVLTGPAGITFDSVKGMQIGAASSSAWDAAFTNTGSRDLKVDGFTLQFEVEKGFFSSTYLPSTAIATLVQILNTSGQWEGIARSQSKSNFTRTTFGSPSVLQTAGGFKTSNVSYDDFVRVALSFDVAGTSSKLFLNEFLVAEFTTGTMAASNILIALAGVGLLNSFTNPFFYRNIQITRYPITLPSATKSVVYTGASQGLYGGYQVVPTVADPNNVVPARVSGPVQDPLINNFGYYQLSTFGWVESRLAEKGHTVSPKIQNFSRGGASILYWASQTFQPGSPETVGNTWADRMTIISGSVTQADYWIIDFGFADALFLETVPVGNRPTNAAQLLRDEIKVRLDDIIDNYAPQRIALLEAQRGYLRIPEGFFPDEQMPEMVRMVNEQLNFYDGYRGIVKRVPVYADSNKDQLIDQLHWNTIGCRYIGERIADAFPNAVFEGEQTYTWPLERRSDNDTFIDNTDAVTGDAFNGAWTDPVWEDVPDNSRLLRINKGSGLVLDDSIHPGDPFYQATLNNQDSAVGGWDYEP